MRKLVREPIWFVLVAAFVVGVALGIDLVHERASKVLNVLVGTLIVGERSLHGATGIESGPLGATRNRLAVAS